jgi:prepilin-type N-terminal cleavage/methylation domain-containing protein
MKPHHGFTLIELVIVMVVVSIGTVSLLKLFANNNTSLNTSEAFQLATQYAQECADKVVADNRSGTTIATTTCDTLPSVSPYTRTVSVTADATSACPSGYSLTCNDIQVTVSRSNPSVSASLVLMIVTN